MKTTNSCNGARVAMRQDNDVYWLHGDHLGSASVATSITGAVVSEMRYYPFGETRWVGGTLPTDRLFTGQRVEAGIGLYDYNARMYSPSLGRFISADTIVAKPGNPQALNRYSYVNNRPLNMNDPSGHCGVTPAGESICTKESSTLSSALVIAPINLVIESAKKPQQSQWVLRSNETFDERWIKSDPGGALAIFGPYMIPVAAHAGTAVIGSIATAPYWGNLSRAADYGVKTYNDLRVETARAGLRAHHIIEERFATIIGVHGEIC